MPVLSKLGVRPVRAGAARLDFIVDGVSLLDKFPLKQILDFEAGEVPGLEAKHIYASRLGCGSRDWQLGALKQLLLEAEPELPDGRRRLYICGGNCECEHIACHIESDGGLIVWRDFQRGSPVNSGAESFQGGEWTRIEYAPRTSATGFNLSAGPFWFDEREYHQLFELLLLKLDPPAIPKPE